MFMCLIYNLYLTREGRLKNIMNLSSVTGSDICTSHLLLCINLDYICMDVPECQGHAMQADREFLAGLI